MNTNIDHIVKNIFQSGTLQDISLKQLHEMVEMYPSFNFAHYMLSKKMQMENEEDFKKEAQRTALYFTNPFWLQLLFEQKNGEQNEIPESIQIDAVAENISSEHQNVHSTNKINEHAINRETAAEKKQNDTFSFGPYYTIDYFASQGIKVSQEEISNDKFGKQLKSFTEWLKTMKKLPQHEDEPESEDESARNSLIENFATHSLEQKEVITETMAEVLIKQGKKERATELYHKLSLLNPSKNAYFAAKIEQLK